MKIVLAKMGTEGIDLDNIGIVQPAKEVNMSLNKEKIKELVKEEQIRSDWEEDVINFAKNHLRTQKSVRELTNLVANALGTEPYRAI